MLQCCRWQKVSLPISIIMTNSQYSNMLSDVHCHLYAVENPEVVVRESVERGVGLIVTNAEDAETARKNVGLADMFDVVHAAAGIHPEFALKLSEKELEKLEQIVSAGNVAALGEVGLDYKFARSRVERDRQKVFFHRQLEMAEEYDLPVIVHSRRAHRPVVEAIVDSGVCADLHWFSGPIEDVLNAVDHGVFFSFGPAVLNYEAYRAIVDVVPLDLIMLETDMPVRFGGKEARPWCVEKVADFIADVKKTSANTVIERAWYNARRFFRV